MIELWRRLVALVRFRRMRRDLDEEIQAHLAMKARDAGDSGAARRAFGSPLLIRERSRDAWGWRWLEDLWSDVLYALRALRKNPGFAAAAISTLALGIGANTAIFAVINAALLRMLPVRNPAELRLLVRTIDGRTITSFSYTAFRMFREEGRVLRGVAAFGFPSPVVISAEGDQLERVDRQFVSGEFFPLLGVQPAIGRLFTPGDDVTPDSHPIAVISYGFWQRRYGLSPRVLGSTIRLDERAYTIVGVAPASFISAEPGQQPDVWAPAMMHKACVVLPACQAYRLIARLQPGVRDVQAAAQLGVIFGRHLQERARGVKDAQMLKAVVSQKLEVIAGSGGDLWLGRQFAKPLYALMAVVGMVLLIACANVANLLLARVAARSREVAIRVAIGAGRGRLVRQFLAESAVVSLLGAALALPLSLWGAGILVALVPLGRAPVQLDIGLDWRVLSFTAGLSFLAAMLFGVAPAMRASRGDSAPALKQEQSGTASGRRGKTLGWALVCGQIALSLVLLMEAGLFIRTLENLKDLNPGFDRNGVLMFQMWAPRSWSERQRTQARTRFLDRARAVPGVVAAGTAGPTPFSGGMIDGPPVWVEGYQPKGDEDRTVEYMWVTPGFLEAVRTPLIAGRLFGSGAPAGVHHRGRDSQPIPRAGIGGSPQSATQGIVNDTFARFFFAGRSPIGMHLDAGGTVGRIEIIGIIRDAQFLDLKAAVPKTVFLDGRDGGPLDSYFVRAAIKPELLAGPLRLAAREIDPALRLDAVCTLAEQVDGTLAHENLMARLTAFFGVIALVLACIGLYGVTAYAVARRTSEIGIRMALGASQSGVLRMMLRETAAALGAGIGIGIPAALACGRIVSSMLFGIRATDPATLALACAALAGVSLAAAYIPARRAARIDPMRALREL